MIIGEWYEAEPRKITRNHTSYAADWETVITRPGFYPVRLTNSSGFPWNEKRERDAWLAYATDPALGLIGNVSPYYACVSIDADRVDGRTFSGFGGLNFASREEPLGFAPYHVQPYAYTLPSFVDSGLITLNESAQRALAPHMADWRKSMAESEARQAFDKAIRACMSTFDVLATVSDSRGSYSFARETCESQGDPLPADGLPNLAAAIKIGKAKRLSYDASDIGRRSSYLLTARMLPREVLRRLADGETVNQIDPSSHAWRF